MKTAVFTTILLTLGASALPGIQLVNITDGDNIFFGLIDLVCSP